MASYAAYVRTRLAGNPHLDTAVKALLSNDFEAALFAFCLEDQLTLPRFYNLSPKSYPARLAMLSGLLPVGQTMLNMVQSYQLVSTSLQNLVLDGPILDATGASVELSGTSYRADFLAGQVDLRDCFLYGFLALASTDPAGEWERGRFAAGRPRRESYELVYDRGISTAERVLNELRDLEAYTKNGRRA